MPETMRLPEYMVFSAAARIEASDGGSPTFSMLAYSGGTMRIDGFPHPVVVDMTGLDVPSQSVPIRLDHKSERGVGHTTRIEATGSELHAEGLISRETSWAKDVAKSGVKGFPWQASIGGPILEAEFVPNGSRIEVNGRTFEGPIHVVRKMRLKEISFVDSGADEHSKAVVRAKAQENFLMSQAEVKTETGEQASEQPKAPATQTPEKIKASFDSTDMVEQLQKDLRTAHAAEMRRIGEIHDICGTEHADLEAKAIEENWDITRCKLEVLQASRPKAPAGHVAQSTSTTPRVLEAIAMSSSGMSLSTLETTYDEKTLEAADKYRGVGLQEFCELACGQRLPRYRRDATGWLQAAFSTAALPGILSNIANKRLLEGYNYIEDTWRRVCKIASVNDFKEHTRYRMTGSFKFEQVGPDGELKHGKIDEMKYGQKADTHGIMFALTRTMIIDDDLGALTDIPRQIGMGAAEAITDAVWSLLLSNPVQSDGYAFFSAEHKNLKTGADSALSVDGLTAAEIAFGEQTKPNGRPLGVPANLLLVPTALKVAAELLMTSMNLNETTATGKPKPQSNPHVGKFDVVSSSYLSNASFEGYSSDAWYLLTDPNRLPGLEVAFLGGVDRPTVERADADFNTLGVQFRGYIDFGVREQDFRAALRMNGS